MHVMIDIETLGTSPNAVILQIGAVGFAAGGMDPGFYSDVTIEDQVHLGRSVDNTTLAWWLDKTLPEARTSVFERRRVDTTSLSQVLNDLNRYIKAYLIDEDVNNTPHDRLWANSPAFDLAIIRNAMEMCSITPSWNYWHEADVRTLKLVDSVNQGIEIKKIPQLRVGGVSHSALDDAKNQALYVNSILEKVKNI